MSLAVREAGKTLTNAIAEVREAVDFCRYYANEAETTCAARKPVGTIVAISPWNFPLAIFTGETIAALAVGNTVIAKPAEQTSLIAYRAVQLMHQAGVPRDVLQLVLGAGDAGAALTQDKRINGVVFTGSTEVAQRINRTLAARDDNPVLIAETGGQNAMIVDSTALAEQVCLDVINSAYDSAGQRCSALRILCLQDDIAERTLAMIKGAMNELRIADPSAMTTDIGPVIDAEAQQNLRAHIDKMKTVARAHHETAVADNIDPAASTYIAPILFELNNLDELQREVFGPVLHVLRYRAGELDSLLKQINQKGYALTHGIHSRIDSTIARITDQIEAGNIYVNRNIVGAVVGVQPFGGHGLSGTGPKAGGSFYLQKLSQGGAWQAPTLDRAGAPDTTALPKLQALIAQSGLDNDAQNRLKAAAEAAQKTTLRHAVQTLGGPTGENNQIRWHLPPHIALYGGDLERGLSALIPVAIAGGHLHVGKDHPLALLEKTANGLIRVSAEPVSDHARHVLALEPLPAALKTALAARDGALVKIVDASGEVDILPLYEETSCSTNTTAAGGNASLMAMAEA